MSRARSCRASERGHRDTSTAGTRHPSSKRRSGNPASPAWTTADIDPAGIQAAAHRAVPTAMLGQCGSLPPPRDEFATMGLKGSSVRGRSLQTADLGSGAPKELWTSPVGGWPDPRNASFWHGTVPSSDGEHPMTGSRCRRRHGP
ncbi:hypothetical protein GCM10010276_38870 [Streptomyces longisporus]|uniref:Uncharacterized protein n=1 Tax=Streptomyces longisporus TaxID=1948 RepID=A0ABN3M2M1_STRLO